MIEKLLLIYILLRVSLEVNQCFFLWPYPVCALRGEPLLKRDLT